MSSNPTPAPPPNSDEAKKHVLDRYNDKIEYYWQTSQYNKRSYKTTRYLLIALGAVVTMVSSLSTASFIKGHILEVPFAILTPVLAASMAIVSGVSQAFQWGAAWSDLVITATKLEKERDRIVVTPANQVEPVKELGLLDDLVLTETQSFFQRLFGSGGQAKPQDPPPAKDS